ncbi:MAG: 23S rRNA (adenine(2503)-C(2))-methyltransferase RlmN [Patescibacteria group bacterium]
MNLEKIKEVLSGEAKYRFAQVEKAIFVDLIDDWEQNTNLPKSLKEKLQVEIPLKIKTEIFGSKKSSSVKALLELEDGEKIETVLMRHSSGRNTVCVSSQVGCALACKFCATGKMGFRRNLSWGEIIEQVLFFARFLKNSQSENSRITNIVFMGMGEPFLNYENVFKAIEILNDKNKFNIGARHISISTAGIVEGINKFAQEKLQINLAISLHAPNNELRSELMPINNKYSIEKIMSAVEKYVDKTNRQVMFEYLLIDGVNDREKDARELVQIINHPLFVVNLIRYNPVEKYRPSNPLKIQRFKNILFKAGIRVTERYAYGQDIKAACGQLRAGQERKK